ncbi:hypothetical protein D9M72_611860 [compost metagenome]
MTLPEFGLDLGLERHDLLAHFRIGAAERKQFVGKRPAFAPPELHRLIAMKIFELGGTDANGAQSSCHRKRDDVAPAKHPCFI